MLGHCTDSNSASAYYPSPFKAELKDSAFPEEYRPQAAWWGIFSSQKLTTSNRSVEQRQAVMAPKSLQVLRAQCQSVKTDPFFLSASFGNSILSFRAYKVQIISVALPALATRILFTFPSTGLFHYCFLCAATIDVVPSKQSGNPFSSHRTLQDALTSPLIPTKKSSCS